VQPHQSKMAMVASARLHQSKAAMVVPAQAGTHTLGIAAMEMFESDILRLIVRPSIMGPRLRGDDLKTSLE
jgi:hypothetical protein